MDIFMSGVPYSATEDDVKVELAKLLHKAPFPRDPLLNFEVTLLKRHTKCGKVGILTLPSEKAGRMFLYAYGGRDGVKFRHRKVEFSLNDRPVDEERVAIVNSRPWRDPQQLRMEKEQRIQEGKPYPLKSYAFGRFLTDKSFSSEFVAEGSADITCDLGRRQVRFTLRKQGQRTHPDDGLVTLMLDLAIQPLTSTTTVSYPLKAIHAIVESSAADESIVFIRAKANKYPIFATETHSAGDNHIDTRHSQGLIPDVPMPPDCFSLMCTFADKGDKEAFIYAARSKFDLRRFSHRPAAIRVQVRESVLTRSDPGLNLDFFSDLPFELCRWSARGDAGTQKFEGDGARPRIPRWEG